MYHTFSLRKEDRITIFVRDLNKLFLKIIKMI